MTIQFYFIYSEIGLEKRLIFRQMFSAVFTNLFVLAVEEFYLLNQVK